MPPTLFAFGITNLAMLGWLAAAAVPWLIHLWSKQRYREVPWAAMEYLLAAMKSNRRRMRLEQWILLIVRTLVVVLVVTAVAEPFFQQLGLAFVPGERTHRLLVIDGSYSMAYRPADKSRFEQAKELASSIAEECPQGDGFTLVLMSDPPRTVVNSPVFDTQAFKQEVDSLTLPHTSADLAATLVQVEEILIAARREHPGVTREEVLFLTDLGRVGWANDFSDAGAKEQFDRRARRLSESAGMVVIDLGQDDPENVAVTSVRPEGPFVTIGRPVQIEAGITNFGRQSRPGQLVELVVDGRRIRQQRVDLPAGGEASVAFSHKFDAPGDHAVEIRLEEDRLDVDNHRWCALPVKQAVNVLCVDGRPSGAAFEGATGYLRLALSPEDEDSGPTVIRPDVVPESALLERDLSGYECIFLCNVAQFTSSEARVLDTYLQSGGSLVFFLGERVLADRYNHELGGQGSSGIDLLPARLGTVVEESRYRLDPLDYRHPIVAPFRDREQSGLLTTPVSKHYRLILPEDSSARVALAMDDGSPLIVEGPVHQGRVVLVGTSADDDRWTLWPVWPSYVPIVREILACAIGDQLHRRNLQVGRAIGGTVPDGAVDSSLVLRKPDAASEEVRFGVADDETVWSFSETLTSGMYSAEFAAPTDRVVLFALNVDTVESDLARIDPQEIRDEILPGVSFLHSTGWENLTEQPMARITRRGGLPKGLLYALLGLLFLETFLAWRFGHHTT